jgi:hypothetical protein
MSIQARIFPASVVYEIFLMNGIENPLTDPGSHIGSLLPRKGLFAWDKQLMLELPVSPAPHSRREKSRLSSRFMRFEFKLHQAQINSRKLPNSFLFADALQFIA